MNSFSDAFDRLREFTQDSTLNAIAVFAAAIALATTPIAFAIMGSQKWFQARRGRVMQRPAFGTVVVATLLVMGIPAIFLAMAVKSQYFDKDRYEFDPNRTLSVLDQGRQYETQKREVSLDLADAALRAEEVRLKGVEKQLHDHVKKLDEALLALGEAASGESPAAIKALPRVIEAMGQARADVGIDSSPRWDILVERIEHGPPPVLVAAAAPAASPGVAAAPAPAPVNGLAKAEFEGELSTVPAAQKALAALLPLDDVPEGWEPGDLGGKHLETFNGENLYEKIDGRAESFVQYDVTGAAYANFHPKGDDSGEVQVYVFEFASPLKAFGKYGSEKPQDAQAVAVGAEGYAASGSVSFYQDQYFIQVVSTSDQPQYAEFSEAAARKISARIGGPQAPPPAAMVDGGGAGKPAPAPASDVKKPATPAEMFALLPDGSGRDHPQYVAQDAFGYSFLSHVFLADYKEGEATWQGFLRPFATPEEAKAVFEKYLDAAKADGAEIKEADAEGAERLVVSSVFGLTDVIFLKGNAVAGANGATQPGPAEAFARKYAQSLPSTVPTIGEETKAPAPGEGSGGEH